MDLYQVIRELYAEKKRLEEAIVSLEELIASKGSDGSLKNVDPYGKTRRGRKNMPPEERRRVSERMKKYWARRRAVAGKSVAGARSK